MVPYLACMLLTAHFYALPPRVLPAIQAVEGGSPGLVHPNRDGSADLGLMQVNTLWINAIAEVTNDTPPHVRQRLTDDPCFSIAAAGAILNAYRRARHGDILLAAGDYHSHTPALNQAYRLALEHQARALFGD